MNAIVLYASKTGNTEKVALQIATELNCKAVKITKDSTLRLDGYDLVFLGTWIYGGEPSNDLQNWLKALQFTDSKRVFALFMTWAGGGASDKLAYQRVKLMLESKGQRLQEPPFVCLGKTFGFAHKSHPNDEDLANARKWTKQQLLQAEKSIQKPV
jgi:flavodoxin